MGRPCSIAMGSVCVLKWVRRVDGGAKDANEVQREVAAFLRVV